MAARSEADLGTQDWSVIRQLLPAGWQQQARETGALRRARGVKDAEQLLRILLIHIAAGHSLVETAARARRAGLGRLSAVALFRRMQASEEWLRWLAAAERDLLAQGAPASRRRLRAVDATTVSEPGSTGTDWRVHFAINLANLQCDFFELTDERGGETWRRVPVEPGDVLLGDRAYGTPPGVSHVVDAGGDVVVRINLRCLPLYDAAGARIDILKAVRRLRVGEVLDVPAAVRGEAGRAIAGRLVAIRRSAQATRIEQRRLRRIAQRKHREPSAESWKAAGYLLLWTTLEAEVSSREVAEYYRWRWQIGVSRQGHIVQSVKDRPRPKGSGLVAWEASWRESKTAEPSDNRLRKECAQRTRLQRKVNADVASLHEFPVAETVDNARKQQGLAETSPMRQPSPAGYQRRHGVKDDVETGEALGARRRNPVEEMPAITVSGKFWHRHQGGGSGRSTGDGRAAKRARREGPGPVSIPSVKARQG